MGICALEGPFPSNHFKDKFLLADTCFLMCLNRADKDDWLFPIANNFVIKNTEVTICINVVVRQELLKFARESILKGHLLSLPMHHRLRPYVDDFKGDYGKPLIRNHNPKKPTPDITGKIKAALKNLESTFPFHPPEDGSVPGKTNKVEVKWDDLYQKMERYLLNSSDAMILNYGTSRGFDGLVSVDRDFRLARDMRGFDIYLPKRFI